MSFLPCELHCHTVHSDGQFQVKALQEAARDNHLVAIAITDHNTDSGYDEVDSSIIPVVKGIEMTTYYGHMLVLGANGFVDWRNATPENIDEKISEVKAKGGIVGIAHPYQIGSPVCTGGRWEFNVKDYNSVDYVEVWHDNMASMKYENERAMSFWTSLLDKGYRIPATYGRDWHSPDKPGVFGCTYLDMEEISPEAVIDAIKNGRTAVSTGVKFFFRVHRHGITYNIGDTVRKGRYTLSFFTDLHARAKDAGDESVIYKEIRIVTNTGKTVLATRYDERHTMLRLESGNWYRAELWGTVDSEKKLLAFTSPIYCE